jgi:hypothetical protein
MKGIISLIQSKRHNAFKRVLQGKTWQIQGSSRQDLADKGFFKARPDRYRVVHGIFKTERPMTMHGS